MLFNSDQNSRARDILVRYEAGINCHDFARLEELVSPNAVFWFSSGSYRGIDEIRHAFEKTWHLIQEEVYSITDVEWLTETAQSATCIYQFHWKGIIDGKLAEGSGRGTACFRVEGGSWKLVHEHLSRNV